MQHIEQMNRTTDALRLAEQDLSNAIASVRGAHRRGKVVTARNYLRHLRDVHELQAKAIALGAEGPLVEPKHEIWKPTPINTGFVGITAEERAAREWKRVFNGFPFWVYASRAGQIPHHFSIAAE
ncbi:hypothetical protein SAMN02982989_3379 [Xaviernesmea oryzae]|uniref:Uncharacterized protein n=1 Tax=Xaviernesmea oryzae TaxID=464029 RepID=A0A1X7G7Y8_9HYPH|nr:hypothetical protein [Xaviernesmea oryzae]SMF65591.1 hypothetical protein SAMN02982989_3379 [Xaviernesmea oryzae]